MFEILIYSAEYRPSNFNVIMICTLSIFFVLTFSVISAKAQCVPEPVSDIHVEEAILHWKENSNCNETSYIITVRLLGSEEIDYVEQVEETAIDLSFLTFCRVYVFTVFVVTGKHVGPHRELQQALEPPTDAIITVVNFTSSQYSGYLYLKWDVSSQYAYCIDNYRLLIWSEGSVNPEDVETNQKEYYISDTPWCVSYQFKVSVQYGANRHPASYSNLTVSSKTNTPSLANVIRGVTTINTTWVLESYSVNRCKVNTLRIQGEQFDITIPIVDSPQRPDIDASLSGLKANTMYYFNVTVENVAGVSKPFPLGVHTLPAEHSSDLEILDSFDIY